ncbi:hypothetical protein [Hymenobacter sp. YC55]|uniref:hypothetical protein n=1 Tax=Hymenobacter sp. YC55 TaxID=3034019 RepID=UPI0023F8E061|nr:hypothetical protein [Hymenobacter sp. YC55]MDF7814329.1 hypothetical protein [Hymenobacter sp. YC55]
MIVAFVQLVGTGIVLYLFFWFIRIQIRRGFFFFPNPFQPGWRQLHQQFGSTENLHSVELISGQIGGITYSKALKIKFDNQDVLIRNMESSAVLVRIPYAAIEVLDSPTSFQVSRLSELEYTAGKFRVGGVKIELPAYWADQLLKHIATAG